MPCVFILSFHLFLLYNISGKRATNLTYRLRCSIIIQIG
nr:MAG TPA: hypothetical protein [Inoviridae sp.]